MKNEAPAQTDISRPTTGFRSPDFFQMHHEKNAVCEAYAKISYEELGSLREERRDRVKSGLWHAGKRRFGSDCSSLSPVFEGGALVISVGRTALMPACFLPFAHATTSLV